MTPTNATMACIYVHRLGKKLKLDRFTQALSIDDLHDSDSEDDSDDDDDE
jgi:hypothetical protein